MKIAIIHDWLVTQRGGENVLDAICELFPRADLFTLVYEPGKVDVNIIRLKRHVSALQKVPQATKRYRHLLPLMPWAIERFDLSAYDLVLSSSHCVAKGVRPRAGVPHVSYVHAPMRYMWDRFDEYFSPSRSGLITRTAARALRGYFQRWDRESSSRVTQFLANSAFIAAKIKEYYGRDAKVVHPFCEPENFSRARQPNQNYLMVTALVPYKRVDVAIKAFNKLGRKLIVVGDGPDKARLMKLAGPTVDFVGALKRDSLGDMYAKCKALVFPGVEDFGIVPIEAMAAGMPVIALAEGGALETVTPETGFLFSPQKDEQGALMQAIEDFEKRDYSEAKCRARGREFNRERFQREYLEALRDSVDSRTWSSLRTACSVPQSLREWFEAGEKTQSPQP